MFDREKLIQGIALIGIGVGLLIVALWLEPLLPNNVQYQWFTLLFRIMALICIIAGVILSIICFIPKEKHNN
jgi:hypothetical protein